MRNEYKVAFYAAMIGLLSACTSLPSASDQEASINPELELVHHDKNVRLYTRPDFDPFRFGEYTLARVDVRTTANQERDKKEEQALGTDLEDRLNRQSTSHKAGARLNIDIHLRDITPVSPVLNAATLVLAFLPLDTGTLTVETIYRDDAGTVQARRIERLSGSVFNIKASFSSYGQHKIFLSEWAERCPMSISCLSKPDDTRKRGKIALTP